MRLKGAYLAAGNIVTGVEIIGIWAVSSCDLFVPSGSAQAQPHMYHFHLIIDCCCVHPASWPGGSDNTQLMLGSSGLMVTWWPIVKMFSFH